MDEEKLRHRRKELMIPLDRQIMMCDDLNEVLILAAAMVERGYKILKNQYGKDGAVKLTQAMVEIVDDNDDRMSGVI